MLQHRFVSNLENYKTCQLPTVSFFICAQLKMIIPPKSHLRLKILVTEVCGFVAAKPGKCVKSLLLKRKPEHIRQEALKFSLHQILFFHLMEYQSALT